MIADNKHQRIIVDRTEKRVQKSIQLRQLGVRLKMIRAVAMAAVIDAQKVRNKDRPRLGRLIMTNQHDIRQVPTIP